MGEVDDGIKLRGEVRIDTLEFDGLSKMLINFGCGEACRS